MSAQTYNWYKLLNAAAFEAEDLPSRDVTIVLAGVGQKTITVTKGLLTSIVYAGVMLSPGLADQNPFVFGGLAAYRDVNQDLWLGIPIA